MAHHFLYSIEAFIIDIGLGDRQSELRYNPRSHYPITEAIIRTGIARSRYWMVPRTAISEYKRKLWHILRLNARYMGIPVSEQAIMAPAFETRL